MCFMEQLNDELAKTDRNLRVAGYEVDSCMMTGDAEELRTAQAIEAMWIIRRGSITRQIAQLDEFMRNSK